MTKVGLKLLNKLIELFRWKSRSMIANLIKEYIAKHAGK